MRLHLVNDEKIINRTIDIFDEIFPNDNLYVVAKTCEPFKWVKKRDNVMSRSEFLSKHSEFTFSHVFIHLLNRKKINILNHINIGNAKVYWIIWGLDLYNNLLRPKGFEMIDSQSSYAKKRGLFSRFCSSLDLFFDKFKASQIVKFVEKRVDYIVTDTTDNDYDYLVKYYPQLKFKEWKDFFYYPIDTVLGEGLMNGQLSATNIMIGNSASMSNNHEYVMNILKNFDLHDRLVYMPLSYSINKPYVETVKARAVEFWDKSFKPLDNFMPLEEYNILQQSVSVALYGNWRQEAIGNILVSLYLGAKVFLSRRNPVGEWAERHGLKVFVLEDMTQDDLDTPLSNDLRTLNRSILLSLYTKERMIELIKAL